MPTETDGDAEWLRTVAAMSEHSCGQVFSINIERLRAIADRLDATRAIPVGERLLSREEITQLMEDLNGWTEKVPPPFRFGEWGAILEHRLGLTEPFPDPDDNDSDSQNRH